MKNCDYCGAINGTPHDLSCPRGDAEKLAKQIVGLARRTVDGNAGTLRDFGVAAAEVTEALLDFRSRIEANMETKLEGVTSSAEEEAIDNVDNPQHYGGRDNPYEVIKVMLAWFGPVITAQFCQLNAIKYLSRAGKKPELPGGHDGSGDKLIEDWRKAAWYSKAAADILEHGKVRP